MKKLTSLGLMTAGAVALSGCVTEVHEAQVAPPPPPPVVVEMPAGLTPAAGEVLRLSQAGTSEDVIVAYIQNTGAFFNVGGEQIVYLQNNGVSPAVVTAMLNHDQALRAQAAAPPPAPVVTPPVVATPPPVYVSSPPPDVAYFYDDLRPYGTWVQVAGIGWCWQPQVVVANPGWRPYADAGHWIYTDAGWYWQSDYSWGWAPFHYGRWQMHERCGWVWVPDRVWGPSWVVWRTEGDYCGWAPLPPHADFDMHMGWRFNGVRVAVNFDFGLRPDHYSFVRFADFNAHDVGHRRLERPEVTKIYNQTTIINNYVVNNNTIINQGVRVERVSEATHTQVRRVPLRDEPAASVASRANPAGATEVAYRTQLKAPSRPNKEMVAQKIDERHPVVSHNTSPAVPARDVRGPAQPSAPIEASAPVRNAQPAPAVAPRDNRVTEQPRNQVATAPAAPVVSRPVTERPTRQPQPINRPGSVTTPATPTPAPVPAVSRTPAQPKAPSKTTTAFLPAPKPAPAVPTATPKEPGASNARGRGQYPLRITQETPANPTPGLAPRESSHVYQPKSARQAAERYALPPANPRPAASAPNANSSNARNPKAQPKRAE